MIHDGSSEWLFNDRRRNARFIVAVNIKEIQLLLESHDEEQLQNPESEETLLAGLTLEDALFVWFDTVRYVTHSCYRLSRNRTWISGETTVNGTRVDRWPINRGTLYGRLQYVINLRCVTPLWHPISWDPPPGGEGYHSIFWERVCCWVFGMLHT